MKKVWLILLFLPLVLNGSFLKMDDTALSFGLGSAGTAYLKDSSAACINPAGTYCGKVISITLSQYFGPESIASTYCSIVKGFNRIGTFGIFIKALYPLEKIRMYNEKAELTGEDVGFYNYLTGINYSQELISILGGSLYGGINFKYIRESLWTYSSYGIAGDGGLLYISKKITDLKLGIAYQNMGKVLKSYLKSEYDYTELFRFGITFSDNIFLNKLKEKRNLFFLMDLIIAQENRGNYFCMGVVYRIKKIVYIQAGYKLRIGDGFQDVDYLRNLRAGLGINLNRISINYSMAPKSNKANQFLNFFDLSFIF